MSIQQLPGDVAAQIKSSAAVTSLNAVVYGLLQNALDAGASRINISVDYRRGNCSVEDNGAGIEPADFREDGGLGKLHHTSKYPPRPDCHGKHGEFLASLAALSLLTISSHHHAYRTHNSLTIHNSRVLARNLPAPPEQRVLAFASGTRVSVRDLFGSMPVRVRQRAIEVERAGTLRDFDRLIVSVVALLLPWPGEVMVSLQDLCARRTVSLRGPGGVTDGNERNPIAAPLAVTRASTLLATASLVDRENLKFWVPIGATASGISVRGCVSLQPVATKRVQFIAIGVRPLLNEQRSNLLYDDINRVFEDSSFGMIEEASLDEDGRPSKPEGFTNRELKLRRSVDRWPMFCLQITLGAEASAVDFDEYLDARHRNVAVISDLLQVMAYEFLKKHHFRPKPISAIQRLKKGSKSRPSAGEAAPANQRSGPGSGSRERNAVRRLKSHGSEKQSISSPFASWSRTKSTVPRDQHSKKMDASALASQRESASSGAPSTDANSEAPLFGQSGAILRKPFDDAEDGSEAAGEGLSRKPSSDVQAGMQSGSARGPVVWVDPTTLIKSLIDPRTGFAVTAHHGTPGKRTEAKSVSRLQQWGPPGLTDQTTVFQPECRIPRILGEGETTCCNHKHGTRASKDLEDFRIESSDGTMLESVEGRITKASLREAEVVAQVDRKFILARVSSANPGPEPDHMLILIDQHAADERCKVERLLQAHFIPDPADQTKLMAQTRNLDKPLRFELPRQDGFLLARFRDWFAHWGIAYEVEPQASPQEGMTVAVVRSLPPSISERCCAEPRLLIDLLRKEIWKLHTSGSSGSVRPLLVGRDDDWVARFHDCPQGLVDLINSKACRNAIMFNDPLTPEQCSELVGQLAACAFPFQCAHGRPSMVPLGSLSFQPARSPNLVTPLPRQRPDSELRCTTLTSPSPRKPTKDNRQSGDKDATMALTWRSFDFFDATQITLPSDPSDSSSSSSAAAAAAGSTRALFENNEVSAVCSGSDSLFLGGYDGTVRIVGPSWKVVRCFRAYDDAASGGLGGPGDGGGPGAAPVSITHMRQVEGTSLLVTVAEGSGEHQPVLKVWALDKPAKKTGIPTCLSTVAINNGKKPFPISALAVTEDLTQVAIGFAHGAVTVIRGDLIHDLGAKQRIVHESDEPITGVELHVEGGLTTLFVATTSRIQKLVISGRGHGQPPKTVEDTGCGIGCMAVDKKTGNIVVAREDAVYCYTLDGRGPPIAYETPKKLISVYQNYIALVSPPTPAGETDAMRRRFWGAGADSIYTFTLIHPDLRIIAHTETVLSDVKHIFQLWGDLYMLTHDGKVFRYREKPLQQRLEMMYQRNLYPLAVELAQKSGMDGQQQSVIYRKYADYLYHKGDYDNAMTQYIKAIDSTEPSQVIRKFLDTQRIHNLIEYLEELHEHHKATSDHTTLLLNCYAKLKDIDKLEKFIKTPGDLKFDLDTAISMCRQGGYYEQAAYLAKKHQEHDLVVDILIEDSKAYDEALDYIWHLDPDTTKAYSCLKKYARVLIENCPKDATRLFIDYYTGRFAPKVDAPQPDAQPASNGGFVVGAANAVQNLSNLLPLPYMSTAAASAQQSSNAHPAAGGPSASPPAAAPKYTPPRPRTAFSSFIDHPDEFIVFLEACLDEGSLSEADRADLSTTLFEMYLHKANEKKGDDQHREEWEQRAKALINNDNNKAQKPPIENSNVLLLSHLSGFRDGTTLVKEQSGLLFDIFRSYTSAKDTRGAIRALRKYGPDEPQLYPAALAYLTSDPRILEEAGQDEVAAILERIDRDGLMAPLQVVQTLAKNGVASMGLLRPYLARRIEQERREIAENRRLAAQFRAETETRRAEIADLGSKPAVFQATRCAQCSAALELPAVHFLCKHSFHQRCLRSGGDGGGSGGGGGGGGGASGAGADGEECPICARDNATIRALKKSQEENAERHELFRDDLERSEDRFKTVSEWFGRGVMSAPNVE
ncbi:hypothetical protein VTH06DRAFT_987 [Thermothelomyces fergusii]